MAKIKNRHYGLVSERSFPSAALDSANRAWLEKFKQQGILADFLEEGATLTIWRPWAEGEPLEDFFLDLTASERSSYSHELFSALSVKLTLLEYGHAALHPGNMIVAAKGVELVDATFNSVTFGTTTPSIRRWLWHETRTSEFTENEWDLVTLLRTASLLGSDLFLDTEDPTTTAVIATCDSWATNFKRNLTAGSDVANKLNQSIAILNAKICNLSEDDTRQKEDPAASAPNSQKKGITSNDDTESLEEYLSETWKAIKRGDSKGARHYIDMFFSPRKMGKKPSDSKQ